LGGGLKMKITPFNQNKFPDVVKKIEFYETGGIPSEVQKWAEFQILCSKIERQKELNDDDIRCQLEMLFRRIDTKRLKDKEKNRYAEIVMKFGL
jgi:hypothetical protein